MGAALANLVRPGTEQPYRICCGSPASTFLPKKFFKSGTFYGAACYSPPMAKTSAQPYRVLCSRFHFMPVWRRLSHILDITLRHGFNSDGRHNLTR